MTSIDEEANGDSDNEGASDSDDEEQQQWTADLSNIVVFFSFSVYLRCKGEIQRHHGLGYDVVIDITGPFFNRKYHVFFDNFFSSPVLFDHLLAQDMYACPTVVILKSCQLVLRINFANQDKQLCSKEEPFIYKMARQARCDLFVDKCFPRRAFVNCTT